MNIPRFPWSIFALRFAYADAADLRQAQRALRFAWGAVFVVIWGILPLALQPGYTDILLIASVPLVLDQGAYLLLCLLLVTSLLGVVLLVNRGRLDVARSLLVALIFGFCHFFYVTAGLNSLYIILLLIPIIAAAAFMGERGMLLIVIISLISFGALMLLSQLGLLTIVVSRTQLQGYIFLIGGGSVLLSGIILIGVTAEKRQLAQRNRILVTELASMTTVSRTIGSATSIEDMLTQIVEMIRSQLGFYHVQVFIVQERTGVLALATGAATGLGSSVARRNVSPDEQNVLNLVVQSGETLAVTQFSRQEHRSEFLAATRSAVLIPLQRGVEVLGVLDVQSVQADAFLDRDIVALEGIASQISILVENGRLQETLIGVQNERSSLQEQLRSATREIERLSQEIRGRAWVYYLENRPDKSIGYDWMNGTITSNTVPLGKGSETITPRIIMRPEGQALIVPITSRGHLLGVMEFQAPSDRIWDNRSLELARAIAQRLALSLDNLRLFEQAQLTVAREQMANQIATVLQTRTDVDALVAVAVESFQQALGAVQTSIRLGLPSQAEPTDVGRQGTDPKKPNRNGGTTQ